MKAELIESKTKEGLSNIQSKIDNATKMLSDVLTRIDSLQGRVISLASSINNEVNSNKDVFAKLTSDLGNLKRDANTINADLLFFKNQIDGKISEIANRLDTIDGILGSIILPINEKRENWMMRVAAIPIQQQQFCKVIDKFHDELAQVLTARNDIKKNTLYRERQADRAALLQNGSFENWVVKVVEVKQAADGSASVLLQPPCRVTFGSDACSNKPNEIRATIPANSPIFRELGRLSTGDFVAVSGTLLYAQREINNQPLPQYAIIPPGSGCNDGSRDQEMFVTQLRYLIQLK